jgi:hypothetical protein
VVPGDWDAPFSPDGEGKFFSWPLLSDLMPWQNNGVKAGRTWVVGPSRDCLTSRTIRLINCKTSDKVTYFKNSPTGKKWGDSAIQLPPSNSPVPSLDEASNEDIPLRRFGYRSFDRQWIIADARVLDRPARQLWHVQGERQVYFASLLYEVLGDGPAMTCSSYVPDLHYFCNRGAKDILPLYKDLHTLEPNVSTTLLDRLAVRFDRPRKDLGEDVPAYIYAILANPAYTELFATELLRKEIRIPFSQDADLFAKVAKLGRYLIWLHTYCERFVSSDQGRPKKIPVGSAKCKIAVPDSIEGYPEVFSWDEATLELHVGAGVFGPVSKNIYDFKVSGFMVVQSWLGYRMKVRRGRKSSPLDNMAPVSWTRDFTVELLELLWVLEATLECYPQQAVLFKAVLSGPLFLEKDLPPVVESERKHSFGHEDVSTEEISMPETQ